MSLGNYVDITVICEKKKESDLHLMSSFDWNSNEGKIKPIKYWDSGTAEHPATTLNPNPNFWKNAKFQEKQGTLLLFGAIQISGQVFWS